MESSGRERPTEKEPRERISIRENKSAGLLIKTAATYVTRKAQRRRLPESKFQERRKSRIARHCWAEPMLAQSACVLSIRPMRRRQARKSHASNWDSLPTIPQAGSESAHTTQARQMREAQIAAARRDHI